jgi:hypothetical protein
MDHRAADQTNAVERYLLGEFTRDEREDFETHMFDCSICGQRVRESAIAIENVKQVFREEDVKISEASRQRTPSWTAWWRMPALVPTVAALALAAMTIYQNAVYIPALEQPRVLSSAVIAPQSREAAQVIPVDPRAPLFNITFEVDVPPPYAPQPYASYTSEFQKEGGASILKVDSGRREVASFYLGLLLPTKDFPPGRYVMILRPDTEPQTEIHRYSFVIENGEQTK